MTTMNQFLDRADEVTKEVWRKSIRSLLFAFARPTAGRKVMHHTLAFLGQLCRDDRWRGFIDGCWPGLPTRDQTVGFERVPSI